MGRESNGLMAIYWEFHFFIAVDTGIRCNCRYLHRVRFQLLYFMFSEIDVGIVIFLGVCLACCLRYDRISYYDSNDSNITNI